MKHLYSIYAEFYDVPVKYARQTTTARGGNLRLACNEGLKAILAREGIKGRRHHKVKLTIVRVKEGLEETASSTTPP
jgi:hypothetical protein